MRIIDYHKLLDKKKIADGKLRLIDALDIEWIFRLIQSVTIKELDFN